MLPFEAKYWCTRLWPDPSVRGMALVGSSPTPITTELSRVVTNVAIGAPELLLPVPVAPIAPEPLEPDGTPEKLSTVIEEEVTLREE